MYYDDYVIDSLSEDEDDAPLSSKRKKKKQQPRSRSRSRQRTLADSSGDEVSGKTAKRRRMEMKTDGGRSGNSTSIDDDADTDVEEPGDDEGGRALQLTAG